MTKPKFPDCVTCKFWLAKRRNPICGECDNGEFYEEKTRSRAPTENELMKIYGRMSRED